MKEFKGVYTALVTPFREGKVDYASLEKLLDQQARGGVDGFVVNGTTAESPVLHAKETKEIFDFVRRTTGGSKTLIVGTGSNSTEHSVEQTRTAQAWGADAALVVVPYYNKPPQRGLVAHFQKIAASSDLPVILYNVPGRTITAMTLETVRTLSEDARIVGIKEASGKIDFAREISEACGREFTLLSGDDGTYAEFLAAGGHGVISVATHVIPAEFVRWTKAARAGDFEAGRTGIRKYARLIDLLFCEANPIPVKKALQLMGVLATAEMRLPLVELETKLTEDLRAEMKKCDLVR